VTNRGVALREVDPRLLAQGPTGVVAADWPAAAEAAAAFGLGAGDGWVSDGPASVPPGANLAIVAAHGVSDPVAVARRTREAARALRAHGCARHFLHLGPDGGASLAAQLPVALTELALPLAVVTPAHPGAGVTCIGGYTLQDGRPTCLPQGEGARSRGHLPTTLGAALPTAHLGLDAVLDGTPVVAQAIAEAWGTGRRVLVLDAAREEDLAAIARAIVITPYPILPVGSAGLARALQPHRLLEVPPRDATALGGASLPVLTVAGGPHPRLRDQVARAARGAALVTLDAKGLLLRGPIAVDEAMEAARAWLKTGRDVLLTSPLDPTVWQQARDLARSLGGGPGLAMLVAEALGSLGARLAQGCALSGLVIAGRDVAAHFARSFSASPARVVGPLGAGAVLLEVGEPRLRWVVKPGASGGPEALDALAARLRLAQAP
jgi:uncharacterized protein YgbK (DUF1537 family)